MNFEERPGTSFTSKRQVQTEQRKRQQMNIGTLETEDKSVGAKIRPNTQDQQRNSMFQKRLKQIPQSILQDRESLYEEVINAKQINNNLQRQNQALQTKIKMMDEELHRVVRSSPIIEQIVNPMESFYQENKPLKSHLIMDLKKSLRRMQEEIIRKDQQIQFLQKNTKAMKIKELEIELLTYQQETQRLKALVGITLNEHDLDIVKLKAENKLYEEEMSRLRIKCKEFESKATMYQNEKNKKDLLNKYLKKEIEDLKFKNPEFKKQNKITENEQLLKQDLEKKQIEYNQLMNSLQIKDSQYNELDKKMKEVEREQQQIIDQLERERQVLREQCNALKEEVALQSGRRRTVQNNSIFENKLEILPEGPEMNDQKRKMLPCVSKDDIIGICKELKFKMKAMKIPYFNLEQYIQGEDQYVIRLEELNEILISEPFLLKDSDSLKIARYLVEDNDDKYVEFNPLTEGPIPRVKSIFKNLIGNYSLLDKAEEDSLHIDISYVFTKYKNSLEEFIQKQKKKQEYCEQQDLEEALKFVEQTFTSAQYEYVLLKNYELTQELTKINFKKLFQLFHTDISTNSKIKSEPDLPKVTNQRSSVHLKGQNQNEQNTEEKKKQVQQQEEQERLNKLEEDEKARQKEEERLRNEEIQRQEELIRKQKEEEEIKRRQEEKIQEERKRKQKEEEEEQERIQIEEQRRHEEDRQRKLLEQQQQQELEEKKKQELLKQEELLKQQEQYEQGEDNDLKEQEYQQDQQQINNQEEEYEQDQFDQEQQNNNIEQKEKEKEEEYDDQQFEQQQSKDQSQQQDKSQKNYEDEDFEL